MIRTGHDRTVPLGLATKLNYSVGQIGIQMLMAAVSFFLMIFYTDVALVAPAVASSALLVGKVWDTVNDPVFGYMVDRTRSRHGRRRVYLIYGAAPLAVLAAAVWMVPAGLSPLMAFIWIAVSYTLFDTALTLVQLPYQAMAAEMTHAYDERTSLIAYSSFGALLGFVLGSVVMPMVVKAGSTPQIGYALAGGGFGVIVGVCLAWVAWRVREPETQPAAGAALAPWSSLRTALRSRPFVLIAFGCGLARVGLTLATGALAYFVIYQLGGNQEAVGGFLAGMLGVVAISIPAWKKFADRWEKNFVYVVALGLAAVGFVWLYFLKPGQTVAMWSATALIGLGMGGHWVVPFSMLPDAIDFAQVESGGERRTGMFYGLFGLVDKLARTIATAAIGWILQAHHYVPNVAQTEESLLGIRLTVGLLPAVFVLMALPLLLMYPVTRARHAAMIRLEQADPAS